EAGLAIVSGIVLLYAWSSAVIGGMAAVTGAYLAGLLVARTEMKERVNQGMSAAGYGFFIPLFFVGIGVQTRAVSLGAMPVFTTLLIVLAAASKGIGCWFGARVSGCTSLEALRIGTGMITRGEVALVIATIGLQSRIIDEGIFSATVVMTLVTTIATPVLLRFVFALPRPARVPSQEVEAEAGGGLLPV
ncbi:MAG: cation:proton antiporter, partial [Chloroflexi bacterium]|nr:cation:proton antiporter [Chloroflexota bacterium]